MATVDASRHALI